MFDEVLDRLLVEVSLLGSETRRVFERTSLTFKIRVFESLR